MALLLNWGPFEERKSVMMPTSSLCGLATPPRRKPKTPTSVDLCLPPSPGTTEQRGVPMRSGRPVSCCDVHQLPSPSGSPSVATATGGIVSSQSSGKRPTGSRPGRLPFRVGVRKKPTQAYTTTNTASQSTPPEPVHQPRSASPMADANTHNWRRRSSDQTTLTRILQALTPCRSSKSSARRSQSVSDLANLSSASTSSASSSLELKTWGSVELCSTCSSQVSLPN
ncbi:unnamed protein product [Protopolystoma xenopodis]|uniref:Uncharacterized protein n=1 Tax=Protopolystoma xenopodis TaxID=117903 RepID=A0A3S4ZWS6_9PLAT|nr:unnamed protein product [Protopolystoma xenopodis]